MLIGLHERGEHPDLILFADTGGERPETYKHLEIVNKWCESIGFPSIVTVMQVKNTGENNPLYELCIEKKMLPSIACGYKTCSQKHKIAPQDKYVNHWQPAKDAWTNQEKVTKLIGYDADETHRTGKDYTSDKYDFRYPLVEWGWGRDDCIEAIDRAGLPQPGKSSCFFCPSSKPKEILELGRKYPELLKRALEMEANAELTSVKGLGRSYAWADLVHFNNAQLDMFNYEIETPCGCYDG